MAEAIVPIFRVSNASESAGWYQRLGFEVVGEHRFAPNLPQFLFLKRGDVDLYLSEHKGDAPKRSLAYLWVDDIDKVAAEFGAPIDTESWGREVALVDPDGNRIRAATAARPVV
jgi:catechol 2,3-dioxygenase-like lactoylglutathione lyase family enzyme